MKYILHFSAFILGSCASLQTHQQVAEFERPAEYVRFYRMLDEAVKEADVRDASDFTIPGFPYLRVSLFFLKTKLQLTSFL